MLCVKYSNRTKQEYTRCNIIAEDMKRSKRASPRTLDETRSVLTDYDIRLRKEEEVRGTGRKLLASRKKLQRRSWTICLYIPYFPCCPTFYFLGQLRI